VIPTDALDAIDDLARTAMARDHIPGLAYGVLADGALVHEGGFGTIDVTDPSSTPDARSRFRIASMTKSFTAAAVLLARDEGLIKLDDPISRHVPELSELRGPTADSPVITVRHLLTMSAGLATDDPWADRHLDMAPADLTALLRSGAFFATAPGVGHTYSNLGYAVLGRAVGNVVGSAVQDVISRRLLGPLGMHDTTWHERPPSARPTGRGYRWQDGEWRLERALGDGSIAPMGGLWSTIEDLGRWVDFLSDAFPPRDDLDDAPLSRASRREMQQVNRALPMTQTIVGPPPGRSRLGTTGYGMGLRITLDPAFGTMVDHSGGLPGFGSNMRWVTERRLGVIALANVTYANMRTFTRDAFDVLLDHGTPALLVLPVSVPLAEAAAALVGLLNDWDDGRAEQLFADNVLLDDDAAHQRASATALLATHGPLRVERIDAASAAEATITATGPRGRLSIAVLLSPLNPPRIQKYTCTSAVEASRVLDDDDE